MRILCLSVLTLVSAAQLVFAQGTVIFDQQSSDETRVLEGGIGFGHGVQSFTPTLDSIAFVRLVVFNDFTSIYLVNVRRDSPAGPILGTSDNLMVPKTSSQTPITLVFSTPVDLTPGTTYYLEPVALLGGGLLNQSGYLYPGGTLFVDGVPSGSGFDMWFREGIMVPEPGPVALVFLGMAVWLLKPRSVTKATIV